MGKHTTCSRDKLNILSVPPNHNFKEQILGPNDNCNQQHIKMIIKNNNNQKQEK